jgi:hypothetical protein
MAEHSDGSAQLSNDWPPKNYRTRQEAEAWLPAAREILDEVQRRVPADRVVVHMETLFVGRIVPEIIGCVAASLTGIPRRLAPVEFPVDEDFETTVVWIVEGLLRWRERVESELAEGESG